MEPWPPRPIRLRCCRPARPDASPTARRGGGSIQGRTPIARAEKQFACFGLGCPTRPSKSISARSWQTREDLTYWAGFCRQHGGGRRMGSRTEPPPLKINDACSSAHTRPLWGHGFSRALAGRLLLMEAGTIGQPEALPHRGFAMPGAANVETSAPRRAHLHRHPGRQPAQAVPKMSLVRAPARRPVAGRIWPRRSPDGASAPD